MDYYIRDPVEAVNYINRTLEMVGITPIGTFPSDQETDQAQTIQAIMELLEMRNRELSLKSDVGDTIAKLEYDKLAAM